jgi:hypothetical protein
VRAPQNTLTPIDRVSAARSRRAPRAVDKLYRNFDRRGTWARSTKRGREFRAQVVQVLATLNSERPAGPARGMRANKPFFSRNE